MAVDNIVAAPQEGAGSLPPLIRQKSFERYTGMSGMTVHRLIRSGDLPAPLKIGGQNFFFVHEIQALLDAAKAEAQARLAAKSEEQETEK